MHLRICGEWVLWCEYPFYLCFPFLGNIFPALCIQKVQLWLMPSFSFVSKETRVENVTFAAIK